MHLGANTHNPTSPDALAGERAALLRLRDELDDARRRAQAHWDNKPSGHGGAVAGGVVLGLERAIGRLNLELARVEEKQHKARLAAQ